MRSRPPVHYLRHGVREKGYRRVGLFEFVHHDTLLSVRLDLDYGDVLGPERNHERGHRKIQPEQGFAGPAKDKPPLSGSCRADE